MYSLLSFCRLHDGLTDREPLVKGENNLHDALMYADCKIVDFGNACWITKQFTADIQTRQYRCPEVINKITNILKRQMQVCDIQTPLAPNPKGLKDRPCFDSLYSYWQSKSNELLPFCSTRDFCSQWAHLRTPALSFNRCAPQPNSPLDNVFHLNRRTRRPSWI